jgi:hypothetical protein
MTTTQCRREEHLMQIPINEPRASLAAALLMATTAGAQGGPSVEPGNRSYSPYPEQNFPNRVFFGYAYLHSSYSTDAKLCGDVGGRYFAAPARQGMRAQTASQGGTSA